MAKALYNPKYLELGGQKIPNTASVNGFVWSHARWNLKVNEMKKFPDEVANAMLKHCSFLVEVDKENIEKVKDIIKEKKYKCKYCDFEVDLKMAFMNHMKKHENEQESGPDFLGDVEEASPSQIYQPTRKQQQVLPDQKEGIPIGGTKYTPKVDGDGVGWYGEGLEDDVKS